MLDAKIIMFSRSLTRDYNWIYSVDFLNLATRRCILDDYEGFEKNKEKFLGERHLVVYQSQDGLIAYKFMETHDRDQNSRKIYALLGCIFSGIDLNFVQTLHKYIILYLYEKFDTLFYRYQSNIPANKENTIERVYISLDAMLEYYRNNKNALILMDNISDFINQYPDSAYRITNKNINLLTWDNIKTVKINKQSEGSILYYNKEYQIPQNEIVNINELQPDDEYNTGVNNICSKTGNVLPHNS